MNAYANDFGPPSESIDIAKFIQSAVDPVSRDPSSCDVFSFSFVSKEWESLPNEEQIAVAAECSISDIKNSVSETWNDPRLSSHLLKSHQVTVGRIHESADTSSRKKRKRQVLEDPSRIPTEVTTLQNKLDAIKLRCWPLKLDSALFIRAPKNSDQNALMDVKKTMASSPALASNTHEALLTITVYNRLTWNRGYLSRASQHVVLASQTLGDLFQAIPCSSNEIPEEIIEDGHLTGYKTTSKANGGAALCIDGLIYGDGQSEVDYADKVLAQVNSMPVNKRPLMQKASTTMQETPFTSLSLRLNEPYWLLHQGNCEHFIIIDHIRLQHPSDIPSGYPLTIQITPPLLDLCRGCSKVPAVWSIIGNMRLGESPCVLCEPCWRNMGDPDPDDEVVVVPLPKHEFGWRT